MSGYILWLVVVGVVCFVGGTVFGMKWKERILLKAGRLKDTVDKIGKG